MDISISIKIIKWPCHNLKHLLTKLYYYMSSSKNCITNILNWNIIAPHISFEVKACCTYFFPCCIELLVVRVFVFYVYTLVWYGARENTMRFMGPQTRSRSSPKPLFIMGTYSKTQMRIYMNFLLLLIVHCWKAYIVVAGSAKHTNIINCPMASDTRSRSCNGNVAIVVRNVLWHRENNKRVAPSFC